MSLTSANRSALGMLRVLLASSLVVPLALFGLASWVNYDAAFSDAIRDLQRSTEVAREHAAKVFDAQSQVIDRVNDLVRGMDAAAIARAEFPLHEAFARIVARLPQVQSVLLAGRDGRPLVSAGTYPVPAQVDLNGRDYFRAVVDGYDGTYVSSLQVGDVNKQLFFGLARPWTGSDNTIRGVIDVAVSPTFFGDFYGALIGRENDAGSGRVMTLIRDDGQILVRYPAFTGPPPRAAPNSVFLTTVRRQPEAGVYESHSIVDSDAPDRLYAYRKVQGYPVYVVAGRSRTAFIAEWRRTMASHLIFGVPATLALFGVTWAALVRTRREEDALRRAQAEMVRRETAEAALLRAQRLEAVGQVTGGVAHDFNNLLTIILGGAEMIGRRAGDPDVVRRVAEQIKLAARRGGEVTQQLLAFSRRQLVHPEVLDLNRCLVEFKQLLDRAASEAVQVQLDLGPDLHRVRLDPGHFEAAILNLVGNARDAMPRGGGIVIATCNVSIEAGERADLAAGAFVRVTVADEGEGMDPETAAKAVEPFFTTKEVGRGTGLGLSQVYGFAKQAGGDVRIVTAPGAGTTVEILLPRATDISSDVVLATEGIVGAGNGEVVLIVEDEPTVLEMAVESLRDLGYTTMVAGTAAEALARLEGPSRIDALFSDVVMPGGTSGFALASEARRLRPGLRVLLTSGYAGELCLGDTPELALLTKPYDRSQLGLRLRAVLSGVVL